MSVGDSQNATVFRDHGEDNDVAVIANILRARKLTILGCFFAGVILAFVYVAKTVPQYVALSEIQISASQNISAANIAQALGGGTGLDITDLRSRVEILQSRDTVRQLIQKMGLYKEAEVAGSSSFQSFDEVSLRRREIIVAQVKKRLAVKPVLGTSLVDISYRSGNPLLAADVVNTLIQVYMMDELATKRAKSQQVSDWLAMRLDALREEVAQAETALEQERQKTSLSSVGINDSRLQQIDLLGRELAKVESQYTELTSKIARLEKVQDKKTGITAITDITQNKTIAGYKAELVILEQKKSGLSQKYGGNHPVMRAHQDSIRLLRQNIMNEVHILINAMKNDAEIAKQTIDDLHKKIDGYRSSYQADAPARLSIRDLESEALTARTLLNNFMTSYRESLQNIDFQKSDVTIISKATSPTSPSYPQKPLVIVLCAITGLFIGIFTALVLEKLQNVFQSVAQVESLTGIPVYGVLARARKLKSENPADFISNYAATGLAELVRSLYMALKLRDPKMQAGGRVVTVTSTLPNEGKTTTAIWLATIAAKNGDKVLIIDADMRRPSLHKKYEIGNAKGLSDYLSDRLPLEDVIFDRHPTGVHIMTSKAIPTHALTLLTSERMEALIRRVRDMYDLILIDVPTSLIFSDARVMAKMSDKTFYIIESQKTRRDVCMGAMKQFTDMNYKDLAIVLNKAPLNQHMRDRKGDLAYIYQMQKG